MHGSTPEELRASKETSSGMDNLLDEYRKDLEEDLEKESKFHLSLQVWIMLITSILLIIFTFLNLKNKDTKNESENVMQTESQPESINKYDNMISPDFPTF